jgi:thiamine-phosphate pyrophosphorylase
MRETGFDIYLVTDRRLTGGCEGLIRAVEGALEGGIKGVQLREKDLAGGELLELACRLRELTTSYGAKLIVNDRVDVALSAGADGVHLGQNSFGPGEARKLMKEALIGVSTHSLKEALEAQTGGADFITLGPVYQTPSKKEYGEPIGLGPLKEVTRALSIPVFAIGGIKKEGLKQVISSGAFGAAVISAVLGSSDVRRSSEELKAELAVGPKKGEHTELV